MPLRAQTGCPAHSALRLSCKSCDVGRAYLFDDGHDVGSEAVGFGDRVDSTSLRWAIRP